MPFPKSFYYTESSSGKRYVRDPIGSSGILDLDRLRAGLAAWEDHSPKRITKPRKLILSDWTADTWNYAKTKQVQTALKDLLAQGFELYLWQSEDEGFDQILPLDERHLFDLQNLALRRKIRLSSHSAITAAAAEHRLSQDNTLILDDHGITQLLHHTENIARRLPVDALDPRLLPLDEDLPMMMRGGIPSEEKARLNEQRAQLMAILSSFDPPFQSLALRADSSISPNTLKTAFPTLSIVKEYNKIHVSDTCTPEQLLPFQNAKTLYLSECEYMNPEQYKALFTSLPHLEEIVFHERLEDFSALLSTMPSSVRSLRWSDSRGTLPCQKPIPTLPHLESLVFENTLNHVVSAHTVEMLLNAATNLQTLQIDGYWGKPFALFQKQLPQLEHLEHLLLTSFDPPESARQILAAAPALRYLELASSDDPTVLDALPHPEQLETLSLPNTELSAHDVFYILHRFPHIKSMPPIIPPIHCARYV